MPRPARLCPPDVPQHVIQRGNNRQPCFHQEKDFFAYAHWLDRYSREAHVAIHAWVFMTNHVHLLVTPKTGDGVSRMMQSLGRQYVRYFNHAYQRTGSLWEGRFRSGVIEQEEYLLLCQRYIELNPVRAGMVERPDAYPWSSYQANACGRRVRLWTPHPIYLKLGDTVAGRLQAYRELFACEIEPEELAQIRDITNKGLILGSDRFRRQLASQNLGSE